MDAKLDCEVDVEGMVAVGAVDMIEPWRREGIDK